MLIPQAFREVMVQQQHLARHSAHLDGKMQRISAMTSATVGILTGIFGGIILIKLGTKRNYTKFVKISASFLTICARDSLKKENARY